MTGSTTPSRVVVDPARLVGKPVVRGTRLSVEFLIGLTADGWSQTNLIENYPGLAPEDLQACLAYARDMLARAIEFSTKPLQKCHPTPCR
jgi:uncharacterized protein (DUF433 family)